MKQRGFTATVNLILVLAVIASVIGAFVYVRSAIQAYGKSERQGGKDEVMSLWKSEALEAAREDTAAAAERGRVAAENAKNLQTANARAAQAEEDLRRKRHADQANNVPTTVVEGCAPAAAGQPTPRVRFTWNWVRDYDAAWTGSAGESIFRDRSDSEGAGAGADTASPYGPAELADVHADNAAKCSRTRRQLNKLLDTLDALELLEGERLKRALSEPAK